MSVDRREQACATQETPESNERDVVAYVLDTWLGKLSALVVRANRKSKRESGGS